MVRFCAFFKAQQVDVKNLLRESEATRCIESEKRCEKFPVSLLMSPPISASMPSLITTTNKKWVRGQKYTRLSSASIGSRQPVNVRGGKGWKSLLQTFLHSRFLLNERVASASERVLSRAKKYFCLTTRVLTETVDEKICKNRNNWFVNNNSLVFLIRAKKIPFGKM